MNGVKIIKYQLDQLNSFQINYFTSKYIIFGNSIFIIVDMERWRAREDSNHRPPGS